MPGDAPSRRKVLLVGWDGADWKLINPLLDAGQLPALNRLVNGGVMASLSSLAPLISPVVWTSIATGKRPDRHGVLSPTEPDPGLGALRPVTCAARKTVAIWDILRQAGLKTQVINWYATHPARLGGTTVSDRFARAVAAYGEPWPIEPGTCWPPEVESPLAALRVHPGDLCGEQLLSFVPRLAEIDQRRDPRLATIAGILAETVSVHAAATWLLEQGDWDFLAVHYAGLEQWGHAFLRYCAPQMPGVTDRDCQLYGEVVSAGYQFYDLMLARLIELAGDDATVLLVSDHGFCTGDFRPRDPATASAGAWHRGRGIFCLSGPTIRADDLLHGASVLDVAPTILTLFGLPVGDDMEGRPLLAAWQEPAAVQSIPSWDDVCQREGNSTEADVVPSEELLAALADLESQGYADELPKLLAPLGRRSQQVETYHLALVHLTAGRAEPALALFEQLHPSAAEEHGATLYRAYCHYLLGRYKVCRDLLTAIDEGAFDYPLQQLLLAMISLAEHRPEEALERLQRATQTQRREPYILCYLGRAYLQLQNYSEAEIAFRRALEIDEDCVGAHVGLALGFLRQQRWEEAADAALCAVAIDHHQPEAHFLLGVALARMQRYGRAMTAFETAVSLRKNYSSAHQWLARLHPLVTGDYRQAGYHQFAANLHRTSDKTVAAHGTST